MATKIELHSVEDSSINYIVPCDDGGFFESRFVQRSPEYFIIYLSSHSGCNQACRFCHLTQTGQTMMTPATIVEYQAQALEVLSKLNLAEMQQQGLRKVKFSFMGRGEPLLNPIVLDDWDNLRRTLKSMIPSYFDVEFCVSTIYPLGFDRVLEDIFKTPDVVLYYSIYSTDDDFRRKWIGKSHPAFKALTDIRQYLEATGNRIKFHSAFIKDQNDSYQDIRILSLDLDFYIRPFPYKFNIVRYNPYSEKQGEESPRLAEIQKELKNAKIISRVGRDVMASCGMFYNENKNEISCTDSPSSS
jgi:adenine C2-methylase RlmN of 23S rRNA A2503 and tRNA A37